MRKFFDTRLLLTTGLMSLVISVLLGAMWLGLMPDRRAEIREGRAALAETIAAGVMGSLAAGDLKASQDMLEFLIDRNGPLQSSALRTTGGQTLVVAGRHNEQWIAPPDSKSTDSAIVVPLSSGGKPWGQLELRFQKLDSDEWWAFIFDDRLQFLAFVAIGCFSAFFFYLRRMLKHLDPSRAVPDRVRKALDTLAEGLLLIDPHGQVVLANQAFAELVGEPAEKLLGRKAGSFDWLTQDGQPLLDAVRPWQIALDTGAIQRNLLIALRDSAGRIRSFHTNCSPVPGANDQVGGVLMSLDDITELQEKEVLLREATERAQAANQAKSDFLANMSHEIRTPMNAILGFTELMRRGITRGEADTRKQLNTIHTNGKHLLDLINDILDLSKVEAGQLDVERVECRAHRVVHEVMEVLGVKAREKGIVLKFCQEGHLPAYIFSDAARLRQVVTNLVGNAIKFTDQGEVSIRLRLVTQAPRSLLQIDVRDSGIGIASDKVEAIFEPFVQAESSTTRKYGGTGLGLSISRKLARALGGDIVCDSELGKGSTFRVSIATGDLSQVALLDEASIRATFIHEVESEQLGWSFNGRRILVVDDSNENRELVKLVLADSDIVVVEAENGLRAVEAALGEPFDLILMDMQMPVMDGYTATRQLRAQGVSIPIIAFTAHALTGFEKSILEVGCTGYLTKPIDIDAMMELLGGYLQGRRVVRAATDQATDQAAAGQTVADQIQAAATKHADHEGKAVIDENNSIAPIVSRLAGNSKLHSVVNAFVQRLPAQITEMQAASMRGDFKELANLAHWLKGSAGSVGFDTFTSPARKLEDQANKQHPKGTIEALRLVISMADRVVGPQSLTSQQNTHQTQHDQ